MTTTCRVSKDVVYVTINEAFRLGLAPTAYTPQQVRDTYKAIESIISVAYTKQQELDDKRSK